MFRRPNRGLMAASNRVSWVGFGDLDDEGGDQIAVNVRQPRDVSARTGQAGHQTGANRVGMRHDDDSIVLVSFLASRAAPPVTSGR